MESGDVFIGFSAGIAGRKEGREKARASALCGRDYVIVLPPLPQFSYGEGSSMRMALLLVQLGMLSLEDKHKDTRLILGMALTKNPGSMALRRLAASWFE